VLSLGAGSHTLAAATPGTFAVTDVSLSSVRPVAGSEAYRAVTVRSWQPDQRRVSVAPGAASYLEVHENYNPGWTAALDGQRLTPVRLDGWQQAFILPAGPGGTVTLTFAPAATYHLVLIVSVLAAVLLLAVVAWSFTLGGRGARPTETAPAGWSPPAASDGRAWPRLLAVAALILVAGGPVALAVPLLAYLAGRPPWRTGPAIARDPATRLPALALAAMLASGLLCAVRPFGDGLLGPFGWSAQVCALVALAAALTPAVAIPSRRRRVDEEAEADR
jgi:arabinofuranan 3-O-arabinosyltransferase